MAVIGDTSDLDEFIYGGRPILPEKDSYSESILGGVVASDSAGGSVKQQLQYVGGAATRKVTYILLSGFKSDYVSKFLTKNRGQKFIAYLLGDSGIEPFVVQYLDENPSVSKTGFNGSVSLTLQVEPANDRCYDEWLLWNLACYGDELGCVMKNTGDAIKVLP